MIESPTGLGIRNDSRGLGGYGSPRGGRRHKGVDFEAIPGQAVKCPIDHGTIIREHRPYKTDKKFDGLVIENARMTIRLYYCKVFSGMVGQKVKRGQAIATAQDISEKYGPDMTPHVHLEIERIDPMLLTELVDLVESFKTTLKAMERL